jgi:hypothetical protein
MWYIWIANAFHVITRRRYSMMKEIFVYSVGTKLKKHNKRKAIIFTDRIS